MSKQIISINLYRSRKNINIAYIYMIYQRYPKMPPHLEGLPFQKKSFRPFHLISNLAEHLLLLTEKFFGVKNFVPKWKQQIYRFQWWEMPLVPTALSDSSSPSSFGRMGRLWDCSSEKNKMSGCIIYTSKKAAKKFISQHVWDGLGARGSGTGFKNWS